MGMGQRTAPRQRKFLVQYWWSKVLWAFFFSFLMDGAQNFRPRAPRILAFFRLEFCFAGSRFGLRLVVGAPGLVAEALGQDCRLWGGRRGTKAREPRAVETKGQRTECRRGKKGKTAEGRRGKKGREPRAAEKPLQIHFWEVPKPNANEIQFRK